MTEGTKLNPERRIQARLRAATKHFKEEPGCAY